MSAKDYEIILCKDGYLYINFRDGKEIRSKDSKILSKDDVAEIAKWYKKQKEFVSKDLEEAADKCYYRNHAKARESFIEGAQWKKQQMMDKILFWLNNNVRDWIDMPYDQNAFVRQLENIINED